MAAPKMMVLYYQPPKGNEKEGRARAAKLKGVLVQMGIRIKNISQEQTGQTVGYLAGYDGFKEEEAGSPVIGEEVLVMKNFTSRRIDELLGNLRKAGVSKISLKAVITDTNCNWTFYELYQELKKEHEAMSEKDQL